jgi:hypothetical protein
MVVDVSIVQTDTQSFEHRTYGDSHCRINLFRTALCVPSSCSLTSLRLYSLQDLQKYSG